MAALFLKAKTQPPSLGTQGLQPPGSAWSLALPSLPEPCSRLGGGGFGVGGNLSSKDASRKPTPISSGPSDCPSTDSGPGPLLFLQPLGPSWDLSPTSTSLSKRTNLES